MENNNVIIDTDIWLLAFLEDEKHKIKREMIIDMLEKIYQNNHIVVPVQVVLEIYSQLTKKYGIDEKIIKNKIDQALLKIAEVAPLHASTYKLAGKIRDEYKFKLWDSLVAAAALENNCSVIYSENFEDGLEIEDSLTIMNPLKDFEEE